MTKSYEIHPSIGIARVGTSVSCGPTGAFDGYFLGPEPGLAPAAQYRDASGKLKRQAARFRLFECERDATGKIVSAVEVTGQPGAVVTWNVTLANRKAAAPNFLGPGRRNNASGDPASDADLIIGPASGQQIDVNQRPKSFEGAFRAVPVHLGQAWTDGQGRLLVVGGIGKSRSVRTPGTESIGTLSSFADNDDWYDDTSDGTIQASLTFANGAVIAAADVKPAWLIVAPFDFAPPIQNFVTLYDAIYQATLGRLPDPISFTAHVYPILSRAVGYQWVNARARTGHSGSAPGNFAARFGTLAAAATPAATRQTILARLRDPGSANPSTARSMPRLHDETNSSAVLPPTPTQWGILEQWVKGNFVSDWDASLSDPADIENRRTAILAESLPDSLTRVALEACAGGAFFPGIEAGRIVKNSALYLEAFRFDPAKVQAGEITQGNALPWQADFYACAWEDHAMIGWWPAQRPDQVFPSAAATTMKDWDDGIHSGEEMVGKWDQAGIVRPVAAAGQIQFVETERQLPHA